ncbi:hypothetical protein CLE01_34520 [Cryobacterium levicorallinum]|nr:hypothetical protein CLE01_34520 [Cryobacterium levicorallinum]
MNNVEPGYFDAGTHGPTFGRHARTTQDQGQGASEGCHSHPCFSNGSSARVDGLPNPDTNVIPGFQQ